LKWNRSVLSLAAKNLETKKDEKVGLGDQWQHDVSSLFHLPQPFLPKPSLWKTAIYQYTERRSLGDVFRVARWFVFKTKHPNLGKFWRVLLWKILVCIFYVHLVYLRAIGIILW
jgi:hypothetical protein